MLRRIMLTGAELSEPNPMRRSPFVSLVVLAGSLAVSACGATTRDVASAPQPQQMADALPPMMPVEELGSATVQRPITGSCGMEDLQHFVGRPRTSVSVTALPDKFRVIGPQTNVPHGYDADRLTVRIDGRDRIESLSCG